MMMVTNRGELTIGNIARARRMARLIILRMARPFQLLWESGYYAPVGAVLDPAADFSG